MPLCLHALHHPCSVEFDLLEEVVDFAKGCLIELVFPAFYPVGPVRLLVIVLLSVGHELTQIA